MIAALDKSKRLEVVPDFARAKKGEKGFWFTPYGVYGEYDRDNGTSYADLAKIYRKYVRNPSANSEASS